MMKILGLIFLINVSCSIGFDVRITGFKNRPHHGRVEVFYNGEWGTICDDSWDMADARVVCRQLGFPGTVRALGNQEVPLGTGKIWLDDIMCDGNESQLSNCSHGAWDSNFCYHDEDAGVICDRAIRVESSKSMNEAQVEVYLNKTWYLVCRESFNMEAANVACREFGFSEALEIISVLKQELADYILNKMNCDGSEERLTECQYGVGVSESCPYKMYAGVVCRENTLPVRIRGEIGVYGRVEILSNINWLPVCADRNWDIKVGNVVCQQLGFPAVKDVITYILDKSLARPNFWKYSIYCNGSEKSVFDCSLKDDLHVRCDNLAEIRCKSALRLVGLDSINMGRLEAFAGSTWGTVCQNGWTKENGIVACRELGFPGLKASLPGQGYIPPGFGSNTYNSLGCHGEEIQLSKCVNNFGESCLSYQDIGVVCNKRLRLSGLNVSSWGRLELFLSGKWGSIVVSAWNAKHARVACRELGFPDAEHQLTTSLIPGGTGIIWNMNGDCTGGEMSLIDCLRVTNVSRSREKEIGIKCEPVFPLLRMRGGTSTMGSLQIFHQGEWGSICDRDEVWDDQASNVACRELGFPGFVKKKSNTRIYEGIVWIGNVQCSGNERSISECYSISQASEKCTHWYDVTLHCQTDVILASTIYSMLEERIEVYFNGSWGKICDDGSWDDVDSKVVCKSLGYNPEGAVYKGVTMETSITGHTEKWFGNVACNGYEDSLAKCLRSQIGSCLHRKYVAIKCKPGVRVIGDNLKPNFVGRVEVFSENTWGPVCLKNFDETQAAVVVCRELGFPGIMAIISLHQSSEHQVMDNLKCYGDETKLADCRHSKWQNKSCTGGKVAGVICQADVRLQDGPNAYEGFLEIFWKNEWSRICSRDFTVNEANVICRILGYDGPLKVMYKPSKYTGRQWLNNLTCTGKENSLLSCNYKEHKQNCTSQRYPYIKCRLKESRSTLRIIGSRDGHGRVEVLHHGLWGTICDDYWDIKEAEVVCNALGFPGAFAALGGPSVKNGKGPIWFRYLQCNGNESSLHECGNVGIKTGVCYHYEDAGVICNKGLRLRSEKQRKVGLNKDLAGRLEVYYNSSWGVVCSSNWNMNASKVACRQLGFPVVISFTHVSSRPDLRVKFWLTSASCNGSEVTLSRCKNAVWKLNPCSDGKEIELHCNAAPNHIRLIGGSSNKEGVVELISNDVWGALCSENWNDKVASVICRQLGFSGVIRSDKNGQNYGIQAPVNWQMNITCQGDENKLNKCKVEGLEAAKCQYVASVKCRSDIRLSGGASPNNGAVELHIGGSWFPVCGDIWDINAGSVACRHLGYPAALNVSGGDRKLFSKEKLWVTVLRCGNESSLNHCYKQSISRSKCGKVANVRCETGIRLAGSPRANEGRVEIFSHGTWGTICDDRFDMIDANVICKELDYAGANTKKVKVNKDADPSMKIHINKLECDPGDYFWHCSHYDFNRPICGHNEDIKVSCSPVVLGDSPLSNEGRIDIFNGDLWSSAISNSFNIQVAEVACRELGFPGALSNYITPSNGVSTFKNIACHGDEDSLSECRHTAEHRNQSFDAFNVLGVICESQIRLHGLDKPNEGRIEVYFEGAWGTVCDDIWDENIMNGKVACQQLGYSDVSLIFNSSHTPSGNIPNNLDNVDCIGNENKLFECRHVRGQDSDCDSSEDVGIKCKTELPGQPIIIATRNGSSTSFDILIKPPKYPGHLNNIYAYSKLLRNDNGKLVHSAVNRHTYFKHARNLNIHITGYYYLYNISISVENDVGESDEAWVLLRTEENVPGAPKIRPQANSDLSDSLNVTWGKPENPNGVLTGYTLYWEKQDEEILTVSGKVTVHDGRICQYLITNLKPNSSYLVQLSALTNKGEGKRASLMIKTSSSAPETQPTSSQSNTIAASSSLPNKISLALAITFGIILVLLAFVAILSKTAILQKCRFKLYNRNGQHIVEFENKAYDSSIIGD